MRDRLEPTSSTLRRPVARGLSLLLAALMFSACGGARARIRFDEARYPISMSSYVPGPDGRPLGSGDLDSVGSFRAEGLAWDICWTLVPLKSADFSDELNRQVSAAGGEAVVNLQVTVEESAFNYLNLLLLNYVPVWPGNVCVSVSGDIVRQSGAATSEEGVSTPSPPPGPPPERSE